MSITTAAGGSCSGQEILNALGRIDFIGRFGESMRFLTNVSWQTLIETAMRFGYTFTQNSCDISDVGAGVTVARTLYIPLSLFKNSNTLKPMDFAMPPEIFDKAKLTFSFGALPPALGVGGAFSATINLFVKYQWRKGIYMLPISEFIEEDKATQTDILIPSNYYQYIGHKSNPVLSATPTDTIKFSNGATILIDRLTAAEFDAVLGVDWPQSINGVIAVINLGTLTQLPARPLFSNDEHMNEITKGLPVSIRDEWKLDTVITGFVSNTLVRERWRSLYDDSNLISECFENRAIKFTPLIPESSPYAPHMISFG